MHSQTERRTILQFLAIAVALAGFAVACSGSDSDDGDDRSVSAEAVSAAIEDGSLEGIELVLLTHDSFTLSDGIFDDFAATTGATVELRAAGDAGQLVATSALTAGDPDGDVLFGIDNTFLQRGLDAGLFLPYESPLLADVPDDLELDSEHRVTPVDFGDVCVNYWIDALSGDAPATLDDLVEQADGLVVQNPETSSPGFAFLLATIANYGDDWEDYWQQLADGGVTVTSGWEDAYYGDFIAGGGDKPFVVSYATSPVAEVIYAEPPVEVAPTGVLTDSCFRQVEFAGVLAGTDHPEGAAALIDYLLSPTVQADIPLNMFVAPANETVDLPPAFVEHGVAVDRSLSLEPAEIEANRGEWTERWTEIVLR